MSWATCEASLDGPGMCWHMYPACHLADDCLMHVQIVFQNAINWTNWNSQHVSNIAGADFSVFQDKFLYFMCVAVLLVAGCPKRSACSTEGRPLLNLKKASEVVFFPFLLSKSYFENFKVSVIFFPSLRQSWIQIHFSFGSAIFKVCQNKCTNIHLWLRRRYSTIMLQSYCEQEMIGETTRFTHNGRNLCWQP
jgi:hypothetical protein